MSEAAHGGTGNYQNLGDVVAWLREIDPRRVLDVGVGFGRWGFLVREFLEIWNGRNRRDQWKVHLVGVEAYPHNVCEHHQHFYDEVYQGTVERFLAERPDRFDLIILGDVLEHLPKLAGREVLQSALQRADYVLLVLPLGSEWPQSDAYGNPYERHMAVWEEADLPGFSPLLLVRYRDYVDRPFVAGVLSRGDPRGLAGRLQRVTAAAPHRISVTGRKPTIQAAHDASAAAPHEAVVAERGDRLHLALVTREFPPFFGGGIGTYAGHLARLLGEAGHRVTVLTVDSGGQYDPPPNVRVLRWNGPAAPGTGSGVMDWLADNVHWGRWLSGALRDVHAETPIDAVELTDYYLDELFCEGESLDTRAGTPVPIITHFHGPRSFVLGMDAVRNAPLLTKLESTLLSGAPFRKSYSPRMATCVDELWPGSRCAFVPTPFYEPPARLPSGDDRPQPVCDLLYFGRLQMVKGVERFAEALKLAASRGVKPVVTFVGRDTNTAPGEQSMARWLEQALRPALGERLHLIDSMPPSALWSMLRRARVAVLPSLWESLGYTILEAFCSGTPALVSHLAGAAYLVHGDVQRRTLIDVRETDAFAERIAESLALADAERAHWAGELQQSVRTQLAPAEVERRVTAYYRQCIDAAPERMTEARKASAERRRVLAIVDDMVRISRARRSDFEKLEAELGELKARAAEADPAHGVRPGMRQTV